MAEVINNEKTLDIITCDDQHLDGINIDILQHADFFKIMFEHCDDSDEKIRIDLNSEILNKVLDWLKEHHEHVEAGTIEELDEDEEKDSECIPAKDAKFVSEILQNDNLDTLCEVIKAANFLQIKPLKDAGIKTIANMIKGKAPEKILEVLEIESDFTQEEVDRLHLQNEWFEEY